MRDPFFDKTKCDRCGGSLKDGRMQSMFNEDCLCMNCIETERKLPEYGEAVKTDHAEIRRGKFNFKGIGYPKNKL